MNNSFEQHYISVRDKEERVYRDDQVKMLPRVSRNHSQHKEWLMREKTAKRFIEYLSRKSFKSALDIGCGNGWFTNKIGMCNIPVIGIDINEEELIQGVRVFENPNVSFVYGDIFKSEIDRKFDLITFNASFQYFPEVKKLLNLLKSIVTKGGEIHILDSPFYKTKIDAKKAKERSLKYFTEQNEPQMINHYHHHLISDIGDFVIEGKPRPKILQKLIHKVESPFSWYKFTNE